MPQRNFFTYYPLFVSRSDRWQVHHRLTELTIPCLCLDDGRLAVEVNTPVAIVQLQSVLFQLTASRQQLITRLEQSWSR